MKTLKTLIKESMPLDEVKKWSPALAKKHAAVIDKMELPAFDSRQNSFKDELVAKMKKAKKYTDYEEDIEAIQDRINRKQAIEIAKLNDAR
tara:strand:+ start:40 stop:312 length:273 start_codon:yes stop_codon:yes gene_type:complete